MPGFRPDRLLVVSLWADDVAAAVHFFRDVVGLALLPHHAQRPAFDLGNGACLVIIRGQPPDRRDSGEPLFPSIAFTVKDLDEAAEHLRNHGIVMPWGVEMGPESRWVLFHDPAGNLIEFAEFSTLAQP
jgi:catechol 2,3-dioxygenase-like lactoylglutathione lyase family enzyme